MLQIISGKFFDSSDCYSKQKQGIIYSNYNWVKPIQTCVATLEPVDQYWSSSASYVINYVNKIEKQKEGPIRETGNAEIIQQFQLLCVFGLKAFFNTERNVVETHCRKQPKNLSDNNVPSWFVSRFFEPHIKGNNNEINYFEDFVRKVVGMPRKSYLSTIKCLKNFSDALQIINYNIDLAYSMMVYCLESLSQEFDNFEPSWDDFEPKVKNDIDKYLLKIHQGIASDIKNTLLKSSHLKLQKRFSDFIIQHISDDFFVEEAKKVKKALRKSELSRVLRNTYSIRSEYTHKLKEIHEHIRIGKLSKDEVLYWKSEPYLSFNGLVRLTYHVIDNFIRKQEYLETEKYNWENDLPGLVKIELDPKDRNWEPEKFNPSQAAEKLSAFLIHFEYFTVLKNEPLIDIRKLLKRFEVLIPNSKKEEKLSMLAIYILHNTMVAKEGQVLNYQDFIKRHIGILNECSIQGMVAYILNFQDFQWSIEECVCHFDKYKTTKFNKNSLSIPPLIELCIIVEIANSFLRLNKESEFEKWLYDAYLEAAGKSDIQDIIKLHKLKKKAIDINLIFPLKKTKNLSNIKKQKRKQAKEKRQSVRMKRRRYILSEPSK